MAAAHLDTAITRSGLRLSGGGEADGSEADVCADKFIRLRWRECEPDSEEVDVTKKLQTSSIKLQGSSKHQAPGAAALAQGLVGAWSLVQQWRGCEFSGVRPSLVVAAWGAVR